MGLQAASKPVGSGLTRVTFLMTVEFTLREVWQQRSNELFNLELTGSEAHRSKFLCHHRDNSTAG